VEHIRQFHRVPIKKRKCSKRSLEQGGWLAVISASFDQAVFITWTVGPFLFLILNLFFYSFSWVIFLCTWFLRGVYNSSGVLAKWRLGVQKFGMSDFCFEVVYTRFTGLQGGSELLRVASVFPWTCTSTF
jgi:hypothetical protein